jgi:hypothetical protein
MKRVGNETKDYKYGNITREQKYSENTDRNTGMERCAGKRRNTDG